jgi:excisionase family DNA binding protein
MSELTLTVEETAKVLGCSADKVYEMAAQNKIPHVHLGKLIRVPRTALEKWLLETALAEVCTNNDLQDQRELLIAPVERKAIKTGKKHWSDIPGCGGRRRKMSG